MKDLNFLRLIKFSIFLIGVIICVGVLTKLTMQQKIKNAQSLEETEACLERIDSIIYPYLDSATRRLDSLGNSELFSYEDSFRVVYLKKRFYYEAPKDTFEITRAQASHFLTKYYAKHGIRYAKRSEIK